MRLTHSLSRSLAILTVAGFLSSCGSESGGPPPQPHLALVTAPSAQTADRAVLAAQPVVQLLDEHGAPIAIPGVPVRVSVSSGGASVRGSTSIVTDATGKAAFTDLSLAGRAGPQVLRFAASIGASIFELTANVALTAGPPVRLVPTVATRLDGTEGGAVDVLPAVAVLDADSNGVPGITVNFGELVGGAGIAGVTPTTDAQGIARLGEWRLAAYGDTSTVSARVPGLAGSPITFTAVGHVRVLASLAPADNHTCAASITGVTLCWGDNSLGELGDGSFTDRSTPALLSGRPLYRLVVTGTTHSCGLTRAGAAWCWGASGFGQRGDGTKDTSAVPVAVAGGLVFDTLVSGKLHTCGLRTGIAYCWGYNGHGAVGDGSNAERLVPTPVSGGLTFAHLTAGYSHTCGLTAAGIAYCWGYNNWGEVGDSTTTERLAPVAVAGGHVFVALSARGEHTCGLTASGAAWCWGLNDLGQLGDGTTTQRTAPVAVTGGRTFASVQAGGRHTCALTSSGAAYCWGYNGTGALGDGTNVDRSSPVAVAGGLSFLFLAMGEGHGCGQTATGAYCWGYNTRGEIGDGTEVTKGLPTAVHLP